MLPIWPALIIMAWSYSVWFRNSVVMLVAERPGPTRQALASMNHFSIKWHLGLIAIGLIIVLVAYAFVRWGTTKYWIKDGNLFIQTGIITRETNSVGGSLIYDVNTSQSILQMVMKAGNIEVLTADHQRLILYWVPELETMRDQIISISSMERARLLGRV